MTTQRSGIFTYENALLIILGISFGVAFFDRQAAQVLGSFIVADLKISNTQLSYLGSALSASWAIGAYVIARWSDSVGVRKPFLLSFLVIFSICSVISGLAPSYWVLLASRILMGLVEGPFLPVCLAIMAVESSPHRRGVNAGVMQNFFAAILGQTVAAIVLSAIANEHGWRTAFYLAGIPGIVCAVAVLLWVREPSKDSQAALHAQAEAETGGSKMGLLDMIKVRNVFFSCAISVFMVAWMVVGWTFLPVYLPNVRSMTPDVWGPLLSILGIASALSGFGAPFLSDRIGRKPVMIGFCFLAALTPLAAMYFQGPTTVLSALFFIGWLATGTFPLFMGVIPGESIPRKYAATAMGLVVCVGEVFGGALINIGAGALVDRAGGDLSVALWVQVVCGVIGGLLCLFLIETAPAKTRAGAAQPVAARAA
jgi:predicted MFS family arabinose efflux permease